MKGEFWCFLCKYFSDKKENRRTEAQVTLYGSQTARPRPSGQPPRDALSVTFFVFVVVLYFLTNEESDMKEFQIWPEGPASSGSDKPQKKRKTVAAKEINVWGSLFFFYIS